VRLSVSFIAGVAIATIVGLVFALALLSVLGDGVSLGDLPMICPPCCTDKNI
jgi:hypothetical protein